MFFVIGQAVRLQCFGTGDRPDIDNLAIIITDGVPYPASRRGPAMLEAQETRSAGAYSRVRRGYNHIHAETEPGHRKTSKDSVNNFNLEWVVLNLQNI